MRPRTLRIEVSRLVEVPAAEVFRFLRDPANHVTFDTSGMIRGKVSDGLISGTGDVFVMAMHNQVKGDHRVENHVVTYETDRAIGWSPAAPGEPPAGHTWTWHLAAEGADRTRVSQVYDWSRFRDLDQLDHLPVIGPDRLRESLDLLAAAVTGSSQ